MVLWSPLCRPIASVWHGICLFVVFGRQPARSGAASPAMALPNDVCAHGARARRASVGSLSSAPGAQAVHCRECAVVAAMGAPGASAARDATALASAAQRLRRRSVGYAPAVSSTGTRSGPSRALQAWREFVRHPATPPLLRRPATAERRKVGAPPPPPGHRSAGLEEFVMQGSVPSAPVSPIASGSPAPAEVHEVSFTLADAAADAGARSPDEPNEAAVGVGAACAPQAGECVGVAGVGATGAVVVSEEVLVGGLSPIGICIPPSSLRLSTPAAAVVTGDSTPACDAPAAAGISDAVGTPPGVDSVAHEVGAGYRPAGTAWPECAPVSMAAEDLVPLLSQQQPAPAPVAVACDARGSGDVSVRPPRHPGLVALPSGGAAAGRSLARADSFSCCSVASGSEGTVRSAEADEAASDDGGGAGGQVDTAVLSALADAAVAAACVPPDAPAPAPLTRAGYVKKKGTRGLRMWQSRYFVLSGTSLAYFWSRRTASAPGASPRGAYVLDASTRAAALGGDTREFVVSVGARAAPLRLRAESDASAADWAFAIANNVRAAGGSGGR